MDTSSLNIRTLSCLTSKFLDVYKGTFPLIILIIFLLLNNFDNFDNIYASMILTRNPTSMLIVGQLIGLPICRTQKGRIICDRIHFVLLFDVGCILIFDFQVLPPSHDSLLLLSYDLK